MIKKKTNAILLLIILSCLYLNSCNSTTESKKGAEKITIDAVNNPASLHSTEEDFTVLGHLDFADTVHDFGKLREGDVVEYEFVYTNTGKAKVIIAEAKSTCGCTVPDFKREPIAIDEKGIMKVKFNSLGKHGMVEKRVTILTNAYPSEYFVTITAEVGK